MSFYLRANKARRPLISVARNAILVSMHKAWDSCRRRNVQPEEPDFVASLVMNGTGFLEAGWRQLLRPYQIQITGIYCHQTPKVNYSGMSHTSCELGDLLWCHMHTDRQGISTRNAALYQAKKSSQQPYKITSREFDQLKLYSSWPEFTYVSTQGIWEGTDPLPKVAWGWYAHGSQEVWDGSYLQRIKPGKVITADKH